MNKLYLIVLLLAFNYNFAQSQRTLDETKSYITKMINEYGWLGNFSKKKLRAEFEGDLLRVVAMNKNNTRPLYAARIYNFANVYRFKGPLREPGDIAEIIIYVDHLENAKTGQWKKTDFEFFVHNYEVADQLIIAFSHLNKLLIDKKPAVEKF